MTTGRRHFNELASRVDELTDRMHNQKMRMALIAKALRDNRILDEHLREHKKYIEALEGHVSGLEHNIEVLEPRGSVAAEARYRALLSAESAQRDAPDPRCSTAGSKRAFRKNPAERIDVDVRS